MKQTEIGLIPDDWEVKTLNDIGKFIGGGTPNTNNANYWKGNIPWISSSDISKDSINTLIPTRFITKEAVSCSATKLCPKNTILIVSRVGVGKLAISNTEVCTSQDFTNLVCNENVDENFIAYQLLPKLQHKASEAQGTSIKGITTDEVRELQIPIPPLAEQQRIAKVLSDVDALISTTEKLIQKKKNIKQGAMQNLLTGKKRLPGFAKSTNYKQSELGLIPEDWEVKTLGELGSFKNGISKPSEDFGFGSPFVNLMDIFRITKISETNHLGLINSNIIEQNTYSLKEGDILFVRSSVKPEGVGLTTVIKKDLDKTVYSGFILRFREIGNELTTDFKEYVFYNKGFRDSLISSSTVSANTNINQPALKKLIIVYPSSKEEQTALATVLSSMDKEIETLNTKLEKYRNLKTAMMQQLLTGKIRLV